LAYRLLAKANINGVGTAIPLEPPRQSAFRERRSDKMQAPLIDGSTVDSHLW